MNKYFHPDLSATSQMLSDLAFALARDGNPVTVITSQQIYEDPKVRLPARENVSGIEIRRVRTTRFGRQNLIGRTFDYLSFYIAALLMLFRTTRAGDTIVAKTDPPLISIIAWIVAQVKGARLINWLQDVFPEVAEALGILTWRPLVGPIRWLRNLSLRGAEMNVVLGERMQEYICSQGVERTNTTIIHNWANGNLIRPISQTNNALHAAWKLQGKFVVGYSGNMGRAHEFSTIIGAMKRLQTYENIVFLFIGGGVEKKTLEQAIAGRGLRNYRFLPYQPRERLAESLSAADVHLVSLRPQLEGLIVPSKIYGISAVGRPLIFIGDPDGEVARLVARCDFGFAVPTGAEKELAELILKLMSEPTLTESMGNRARKSFENAYEFDNAYLRWKHILTA